MLSCSAIHAMKRQAHMAHPVLHRRISQKKQSKKLGSKQAINVNAREQVDATNKT